jgi:hypothetical protein
MVEGGEARQSFGQRLFGIELEVGQRFPRYPHGSNILKKATDELKGDPDSEKSQLIVRLGREYSQWRQAAEAQECPDVDHPEEFVAWQSDAYNAYRDILDEEVFDAFDSRGALQPSALEEFCFFLLRPLVADRMDHLALGHHEVFQGMYFTAANFEQFVHLPQANYPVGNLDFIIGKELRSKVVTDIDASESTIYVPAIAIECKTYLDRPRWIESDILSASIKRGFPGCLYILLSEFLKLNLRKVNVIGSPIDRVYVLRRQRNVDRKDRRAGGAGLEPIHAPALVDLFCLVRDHLREDWVSPEDWEQTGILK